MFHPLFFQIFNLLDQWIQSRDRKAREARERALFIAKQNFDRAQQESRELQEQLEQEEDRLQHKTTILSDEFKALEQKYKRTKEANRKLNRDLTTVYSTFLDLSNSFVVAQGISKENTITRK